MTVSRDLNVGGQQQTKIWKPWPQFAYSLYNFQGATMMIKGSLLHRIPTEMRFRVKIFDRHGANIPQIQMLR